jgi:hypothetical protein
VYPAAGAGGIGEDRSVDAQVVDSYTAGDFGSRAAEQSSNTTARHCVPGGTARSVADATARRTTPQPSPQ